MRAKGQRREITEKARSAWPGRPVSCVYWRAASAPCRSRIGALFSCYTDFVPRNITLKLSDETILWARRKAAEENTSVSRIVSDMLEREMRLSDAYWQAFERWKLHQPVGVRGAAQRMNRDEVHERR
jgi:hypothetical protein